MSETPSFTIESFYKYVSEGKLMAAKCGDCEALLLPPRPLCNKCLSKNLRWHPLKGKGKLLTYTVIHIPPAQFQSLEPYTIGIVELEDGLRLPGMIRGVDPEKLRIGMNLTIDFDTSIPDQWPQWPRYFFRPP